MSRATGRRSTATTTASPARRVAMRPLRPGARGRPVLSRGQIGGHRCDGHGVGFATTMGRGPTRPPNRSAICSPPPSFAVPDDVPGLVAEHARRARGARRRDLPGRLRAADPDPAAPAGRARPAGGGGGGDAGRAGLQHAEPPVERRRRAAVGPDGGGQRAARGRRLRARRPGSTDGFVDDRPPADRPGRRAGRHQVRLRRLLRVPPAARSRCRSPRSWPGSCCRR